MIALDTTKEINPSTILNKINPSTNYQVNPQAAS